MLQNGPNGRSKNIGFEKSEGPGLFWMVQMLCIVNCYLMM